ncbi:MAG: T9SS type A sorting domain-containing protein [Flavobacterium sp. JAD_PAG50586_2]|nr:MAG: T9SS type A sorting domain-containing protein [Flavobacterium sp. JAD_PAG50586_2]
MKNLLLILFFAIQAHSQVVEVVAGLSNPYGLAVDTASNLYISETNKISFMYLNDGAPAVFDLFTNNVNNPTRLTIANNYLYVLETGSSEVSRFNLLVGPPQLIPYITTGLNSPSAIAVSNNDIVVGDYGTYAIKRINTAATPFQVSLLDNHLTTDIVIDGGIFYFADPFYGSVKSNTIVNPSPTSTTIVTDIPSPSSLLLHDGLLYISDGEEGKIYRINPNGSSTTAQLIVSGLNNPQGMVVFNNELYIAESGANRIVKLNLNTLENSPFENVTPLTISPNPAHNTLSIDTTDPINEISVYDVLGQNVFITPISANSIDVSQLQNGIYIIKAYTSKGSHTQKFIKN